MSATSTLTSEGGSTYSLQVQSCDCSGLCSNTIPVNIHVSQQCQPGWKGVPKRIEYLPGSKATPLAPKAFLDTCGRLVCNSSSLTTTVTLQTDHIGFGCDRETYSTQSQRTLCNADAGTYDLLPRPNAGEQWTKKLTSDNGNESDQIYQFDGVRDAVIVPEQFAPPDNLTSTFSISFWMKHRNIVGGDPEYIVCKSDSKGLNRHHYGLYVHNCRLVFVSRQETGDGFYPSMYRWKLKQVCDQEWHRYTINIEELQVRKDLIYYCRKACYKGAQDKFANYFQGYLAGLSILPGQIETPEVVTCMVRCKEGLSFNVGNLPVSVARINTARTNLTLSGELTEQFSSVLQQVAYVNERTFPTQGRRPLSISTKASCNGVEITIPDVSSYVMVLHPHEPTISITGSQATSQTVANLVAGIKPFKTVTIVSIMTEQEEEELGAEQQEVTGGNTPDLITHNLDSCSVLVKQGQLIDGETLTIPEKVLQQHGLTVVNSDSGIVIKGLATLNDYQNVLRQISYCQSSSGKGQDRRLTLHCSELNGRFVSNDFDVRIGVLHQTMRALNKPSHVKQSVMFSHNNVRVHDQLKEKHSPQHITSSKSAISSTAMAIVVVLCVGFLLFMIVLGVFRIYAAHKANRAFDGQDMDWDDSALNITVNPMEGPIPTGDTDESSEDDDEDSLEDESSSSEEEEEEVCVEIKGTPLEWDDSTMKF
nr:calsyntenin-1-like [Lytechinus pictus]